MFRHCFLSHMTHLRTVLNRSKVHSWDFRTLPNLKSLHLRFFEGQSLVDVEVAKLPRYVPVVKVELTINAQLQTALSVKPQILSCGGCNVDVLKALEQVPSRQGESNFSSVQIMSTSGAGFWSKLRRSGWP